jgi:hypothetical protein
MEVYRSVSTMSKKRWCELGERLGMSGSLSAEQVEEVLRTLGEVMRFDPDVARYTPELGRQAVLQRRKKAMELGVSTYALRKMGRAEV